MTGDENRDAGHFERIRLLLEAAAGDPDLLDRLADADACPPEVIEAAKALYRKLREGPATP